MYQVEGAAVWHSNTPAYSTNFKHSLGDRLTMTDVVVHDLQSQNGRYRFVCQGDGYMVLYGPANDVIWMSFTTGMGKSLRVVYAHWRTQLKIVYLDD
jgi:hypothetical protein